MGTQYKIEDYLTAFHLIDWVPSFFPIVASILLSCAEFTIGALLFMGIRRKVSTYGAFFLMLFMTPLTLYLAIFDPVADCGCFGDALVLSNWATFWKNVVLLTAAFFTFRYRKVMFRFYTLKTEWMVSLYTLCYIFGVALYCYYYLPIIDFRPYSIGADFHSREAISEDAASNDSEMLFILEKDGEERAFTLDNYPDSTWTYIRREQANKIEKKEVSSMADFSIMDIETRMDVTDEIIFDSIYTFLLISYRLDIADDSNIDLINEIYDYSVDEGYKFYALTSSFEDDIEVWCDKTGAEYPFTQGDDIVLKTVIRSNPGLLLIKDGIIYNKWSHNALPDEYDLNARLEDLPLGEIAYSKKNQSRSAIMGYCIPLLLIFLFDVTLIGKEPKKKKEKKEEGAVEETK